MWLGRGGWLQVREYDRQLAEQRAQNAKLKARNDALDADVRDLKTGSEAIEERARSELGMIRQDEVFFQLQPAGSAARPSPGARPGASAPAAKPGAVAKPDVAARRDAAPKVDAPASPASR
jgi:cell division protein FtsB